MPIFMDRHYEEDATKKAIENAHEKDLAIQDQYGVEFLTYWFDEERCTTFCLVSAPSEDVVRKVHSDAHGGIPHEIIEVDPNIVKSFLGRIKDPVAETGTSHPVIDSAFRTIMFTDLKDSTQTTSRLGDTKALHLLHIHNAFIRNALRKYNGREVKHTGDGFMLSFTTADEAVQCAVEIQQSFMSYNAEGPDEQMHVRIGLSAGEPIQENGDLFGTTVQLAARLCDHAKPNQIMISEEVEKLCDDIHSEAAKNISPKGFDKSIPVFNVLWE